MILELMKKTWMKISLLNRLDKVPCRTSMITIPQAHGVEGNSTSLNKFMCSRSFNIKRKYLLYWFHIKFWLTDALQNMVSFCSVQTYKKAILMCMLLIGKVHTLFLCYKDGFSSYMYLGGAFCFAHVGQFVGQSPTSCTTDGERFTS